MLCRQLEASGGDADGLKEVMGKVREAWNGAADKQPTGAALEERQKCKFE